MTSPINTSNYELLDSDTNETLSTEDLQVTYADYADAIRASVNCSHPEGHVLCRGRRVYAMPV